LNTWTQDAAVHDQFSIGRRAMIGIVALAATSVWAMILDLASWIFGFAFEAEWSIPVLLTIFILLLIGLNMAAIASRTPTGDNGELPPTA
jgi:uncharacterized protein YhhL (DUF1145 family)